MQSDDDFVTPGARVKPWQHRKIILNQMLVNTSSIPSGVSTVHWRVNNLLPDIEHATRMSAGEDEKKVSELVARAVRAQRRR
jgi:hypothetical protein